MVLLAILINLSSNVFLYNTGFLWHFLKEVATFQSTTKCDASIQTEETLPAQMSASLGTRNLYLVVVLFSTEKHAYNYDNDYLVGQKLQSRTMDRQHHAVDVIFQILL